MKMRDCPAECGTVDMYVALSFSLWLFSLLLVDIDSDDMNYICAGR